MIFLEPIRENLDTNQKITKWFSGWGESTLRLLLWLRVAFLALYLPIHTIASSIIAVIENLIFNSKKFDDFVIKWIWSRPMLWLCGIKVEVRGESHLANAKGCLYLFNHTSFLDIPIIFGALHHTPRFGAKIELFKIPFFGMAMKRVGMLQIARNQREKVLKIYQEAESRVNSGECFALAPEGTRQQTRELGRFKTGPFIFAINAQVPIVPLVIAGALDLQPKGQPFVNPPTWNTRIVMEVGDPVPTKGLTQEDLPRLQAEIRAQMVKSYAALNAEMGLAPV